MDLWLSFYHQRPTEEFEGQFSCLGEILKNT